MTKGRINLIEVRFMTVARGRDCLVGKGGGGWASSLLPLGLLIALQPNPGTALPSVVSGDDMSEMAEQKPNFKASREHSRPS